MNPADTEAAEARRTRDERIAAAFEEGVDEAERREIVVRETAPLVRYLARRYEGRGEPLEDLVQVAEIGVLNAVQRFDPARGVTFTTFAASTIVGELKRHLRDKGWSVRVPRRLQEVAVLVNGALPRLSQSLGRSPTYAELAQELGVTEDEVIDAVDAAQAFSASSLDRTADEDDPVAPADALGEIDEGFARTEGWMDAASAIRQLPARERQILFLRFFEHKTQSEIAEIVGISQMHVSRLLAQTLESLRDELEHPVD
jgi:RNA polymerase sigma-B factor